MLERLKRQGIEGVPQVLYCDELMEGIFLFVQSTTKTQQSKVPHEWGILHEQFLNELQRKTLQRIEFEKSDYYRTLQKLLTHLDWLPQFMNRNAIEKAIDNVINFYKGKTGVFSAYHADFTPWNMFVENGRLFVFDWEYTNMTYPPMLDRYHFLLKQLFLKSIGMGKRLSNFYNHRMLIG